ncbi:DUF2812 domain-containing protein [[Ruminococcus] torques]|uniref:DUF2812 domain-containing protein n=1 Tax=[Ruminococcus] torques TaxID=33039 RepID=UPI003B503A0A
MTFLPAAGWRYIRGDWKQDIHYFKRISLNSTEELFSDEPSKTSRYMRPAKIWLASFSVMVS